MLKQAADVQLVEAIRAAAAGGAYVNPELGAALATVDRDPVAQLSDRDRELLRLAALGHTNREIGERLFLSVRAIEVNRSQLQSKLGIKTPSRACPLRGREQADRARRSRSAEQRPTGGVALTSCRPPGREASGSVPPSSSTRSRMPAQADSGRGLRTASKPVPSSATRSDQHAVCRVASSVARLASECLTTLLRPSCTRR